MAKILGLDLGTNSIGWAVVEVEEKGRFIRVVDCGVRIFPKGVKVDTKHKESSKNKERRNARQTRKKYFRYKLRRKRLLRELERMGIIPDRYYYTNQRKNIIGLKKSKLWNHTYELFSIRKKALSEKITLSELGRVFLHINKHRGFKSNKKEEARINSNEEAKKESGEVARRTNALIKRMQELNCDTIGEYYFFLIEQNKNSHNPNEPKIEQTEEFTDAIRGEGAYTLREMFENEFEKIWEKQKEYYPTILTKTNKDIIRDDCIFYQRKLRSSQHLRNKCSLEYKSITFYKFDKQNLRRELLAISYKASDEQVFKSLNDSQVEKLSDFLSKNKYQVSVGYIISRLNLFSEITEDRRQRHVHIQFKGLPENRKVHKKYLPCAPLSSFKYQKFRIWEQLNRLRYTNNDATYQELDQKQKEKIAQELSINEQIPFKSKNGISITGILGMPKDTEFNIEKKFLIGNKTQARLIEVVGLEFWQSLSLQNQQALWHNIHFAEDREWLRGDTEFIEKVQRANKRRHHQNDPEYTLKNEWENKITSLKLEKKVDKLAGLTFEPDYAPYSTKALKKLLVFMEQGKDVTTASFHAYGKYTSELQSPDDQLEYKVPPLPGNSLKNPIVERALVEAIGIINAIIEKHGKPGKIRIEMGRELKMPKVAREERNLRNKNISDRREFYAKFLNNHKEITRNNYEASSPDIKKFEMFLELNYSQTAFNDIKDKIKSTEFYNFWGARIPANKEKYLLWLECDRIDPYEGRTIGLGQLFTSEVEIEHIIPYSRSMDNSMTNKTLAFKRFNAIKGNKTPLEYFENDETKLDEFKKRINHFSDAKKERFLMKSEKLGGFLNSQMINNAYIAKQIREHLLKSFKSDAIEMTNGQMTEVARSSLALDQILNPSERADGYNIRGKAWCIYNGNNTIKFIERENDIPPAGYNEYKVVKGVIYNNHFYPAKNRNDHRHHTVDALATALVSLKTQKALTAQTEGYYIKNSTKYSAAQIERMYPVFSDFVNAIDNETLKFVPKFEEKNGRYIFSRESRKDIKETLLDYLSLYDPFQILNDSKELIQSILVSHKNEKIDSQPRKRLYNPNGTPKMVNGKNGKRQARSGGDYVRSNMFEANPYGQTNDCTPNEYVKRVKLSFGNQGDYFKEEAHFEKIIDAGIKKAIYNKIDSCAKIYATANEIPFDMPMGAFRELRQKHNKLKEQLELLVKEDKNSKREIGLKLASLKGIKTSGAKDERKKLKQIKTDVIEKNKSEKKRIQDEVDQLASKINKYEKNYNLLFKAGAKTASAEGFTLKNEGKRKKRLNEVNDINKRNDIPIKKVRVKYISNTMIQVKTQETPRNKKFLKPDSNYTIALYGELFNKDSSMNKMRRKYEPITWFQKGRIDSKNQKRKKQGLPKLEYFEQSKESLDFLFDLKHNDLFIIFKKDPREINWNDYGEISNRLFRVGKFVQTSGEVRLARHHKANVNLDKGNPWVKKDNVADGEGDVLSVSPSTFKGIPLKLDKLGKPDVTRVKAFINEHTK